MIEKKIRVVHLTESYGGQDWKNLEVPRLKYLVVQKCETECQKVRPNTNLLEPKQSKILSKYLYCVLNFHRSLGICIYHFCVVLYISLLCSKFS